MDERPSDIELLEYVEGELGPEDAERVRRALERSPELARTVAELERGREALRAAPAFELPEERLRGMLRELPRQEAREPWLRRLASSPRRMALVLAPVVAAVAVAIALTTTLGDGTEEREAGEVAAVAAQTAADDRSAGGDAAAPTQPLQEADEAPPAGGEAGAEAASAPVASVRGPAREVARILREAGLDARVAAGAVRVRSASAAEIEDALRGRPDGPVEVSLAR